MVTWLLCTVQTNKSATNSRWEIYKAVQQHTHTPHTHTLYVLINVLFWHSRPCYFRSLCTDPFKHYYCSLTTLFDVKKLFGEFFFMSLDGRTRNENVFLINLMMCVFRCGFRLNWNCDQSNKTHNRVWCKGPSLKTTFELETKENNYFWRRGISLSLNSFCTRLRKPWETKRPTVYEHFRLRAKMRQSFLFRVSLMKNSYLSFFPLIRYTGSLERE